MVSYLDCLNPCINFISSNSHAGHDLLVIHTKCKVAVIAFTILLALGITAGVVHGTVGWEWSTLLPSGAILGICVGSAALGGLFFVALKCFYNKDLDGKTGCNTKTIRHTGGAAVLILILLGITLGIVYGVHCWDAMASWSQAPLILPQGVIVAIASGSALIGMVCALGISKLFKTKQLNDEVE